MFTTLPGKCGKRSKICGNNDDYCALCCRIRVPFENCYYLLPSARFDCGRFFRNFRMPKLSIFVNFDLDLHFQGHLLQEFDVQIQCDHFGENFMNRLNGIWVNQRIFCFSRRHISPEKRRLSCAAISNQGDNFFYRTRVPWS